MLVFPQVDPTNFFFRKFDPRGPPTFKMETKQQEPREEEIPIWAMVALKISRKHCPRRHQPYDLPSWGQIKTLTNKAENLVSHQGMPRSPEYIFLLACASDPDLTGLSYPTPLYYRS